MCSVWIQLFLESYAVALILFDLHLPNCQLRHLSHPNKTFLSGEKKNSSVSIQWCDQIMKRIFSRNPEKQIDLMEYSEWTPANIKWAGFKRKSCDSIDIFLFFSSCSYFQTSDSKHEKRSYTKAADGFSKEARENWRLKQIVFHSVLTCADQLKAVLPNYTKEAQIIC